MDIARQLLENCRTGKLVGVKIIIGGLGTDVNTTAAYRFESDDREISIEASPLFVAAGNCNLEIAKYLIRKGANVNSRVNFHIGVYSRKYAGMSPLHAAVCLRPDKNWIQKRAMIELLISSGADASALTANGSSMWMLCHRANIERRLLVDFAVSLTQQFPTKNCAALHHFASSHGYAASAFAKDTSLPIVELLLAKGADPKALDSCGLTPLNVAAIGWPFGPHRGPNEPVLSYLIKRNDTSLLEKINALELAGAMLILERQSEISIPQALGYWDEAQDLRDSAHGSIRKLQLEVSSIVPWRAVEWTTRDELRELQHRPLAEQMIQALLVGRRILSSVSSRPLVHHLLTRFVLTLFNRLLTANRYTELLDICWIMLEGARGHDPGDSEELWTMIASVTYSLVTALRKLKNQHNPILNLETLKISMELVLETNCRSPYLLDVSRDPFADRFVSGSFEPLTTIFHLVVLLSEIPEMVTHETKCCLHQFIKRDGRDCFDGYNLLLEACDKTPTVGLLAAIALLLEVGANPNARDKEGNSALHKVVSRMEVAETDSPIAALLLKYGAHLDQANELHETPLDVWKKHKKHAGKILSPPAWMNVVPSLACWSARSMQRNKIPFNHLSKSDCDFVSIH